MRRIVARRMRVVARRVTRPRLNPSTCHRMESRISDSKGVKFIGLTLLLCRAACRTAVLKPTISRAIIKTGLRASVKDKGHLDLVGSDPDGVRYHAMPGYCGSPQTGPKTE